MALKPGSDKQLSMRDLIGQAAGPEGLANYDSVMNFSRGLQNFSNEAALAIIAGGTPLGLGMGLGPRKALRDWKPDMDPPENVPPWKWRVARGGRKVDDPQQGAVYDQMASVELVNPENPDMSFHMSYSFDPETKDIHVSSIHSNNPEYKYKSYNEQDELLRGTIGNAGLMDIMSQMKLIYPEAETISGRRVTGIRAKSATGADSFVARGKLEDTKVPLRFSTDEASKWKMINERYLGRETYLPERKANREFSGFVGEEDINPHLIINRGAQANPGPSETYPIPGWNPPNDVPPSRPSRMGSDQEALDRFMNTYDEGRGALQMTPEQRLERALTGVTTGNRSQPLGERPGPGARTMERVQLTRDASDGFTRTFFGMNPEPGEVIPLNNENRSAYRTVVSRKLEKNAQEYRNVPRQSLAADYGRLERKFLERLQKRVMEDGTLSKEEISMGLDGARAIAYSNVGDLTVKQAIFRMNIRNTYGDILDELPRPQGARPIRAGR